MSRLRHREREDGSRDGEEGKEKGKRGKRGVTSSNNSLVERPSSLPLMMVHFWRSISDEARQIPQELTCVCE
jgi:hypothetical protein